ncbi:MAG: efflux RND transporter periplasmic adaptor subunit [Tateyamaria sp.]|uniref:efflux RND transporter periplasmic adaptor subunit n=1 Tax=Tateyamaria sp. TaxID=1929288 RepID=UPI00329C7DA6
MNITIKPTQKTSIPTVALTIGLLCLAPFSAAMAQSSVDDLGPVSASGTGIVVPALAWDISAEVSNQIKKIHFREGQFVKEGDLLVTFDTLFKKLDIRLAELNLIRAQGNLAKIEEDFERKQNLDSNAVSDVQLREIEVDLEIAKADAEEKEILLEKAKILLQVQEIFAPFDGQVSTPLYRDNANVNTLEDTEIATLVQLDPIHVRVSGSYNRLLERFSQGMSEAEVLGSITLTLELPDGSDYPHLGKMLTTSFGYDSETGLGTGIAEFPNPDLVLRPGIKVGISSYDKK